MSVPVVTALIDTYNYGHFIEEAVESVLSQGFPMEQVEILVVDDGSTDDTPERMKKYGSRIKYFRKPNGGQASALNLGFQVARGDIVALLDGDDWWLPKKLQSILSAFSSGPNVCLVYHQLEEFEIRTGKRRLAEFRDISGVVSAEIPKILTFTASPTSGLAFRRMAVAPLFPIPEAIRTQADGYLAALATFLGPAISIPQVLGIYRIHGSNLYFRDSKGRDLERQTKRTSDLRAVVGGMESWFAQRKLDRRKPEVRAVLSRWHLFLEQEEFKLQAPGRIRLFCHLVRAYITFKCLMTWKIKCVNQLNFLGALLFGYKDFDLLDRGRKSLTRLARRLVDRSSGNEERRSAI